MNKSRRCVVPRSLAWRAGTSALLVLLAAVFGAPTLYALLTTRAQVFAASDEDLDGGVVGRGHLAQNAGFDPCTSGFCLSTGGRGTFTYRPPMRGWTVAKIWINRIERGWNRVSYSLDGGQTYREFGRDVHAAGAEIIAPEGSTLVLVIEAEYQGAGQVLVLDKLSFRYSQGPVGPPPPTRGAATMAVLAFGLALLPLTRRWGLAAATLVLVTAAFAVRYDTLAATRWAPLEPDAHAYRVYARQMVPLSRATGFYSATFGEREPLFVLATHLFFKAFGSSDFQLRLLSFVVSVLLVYIVIRFVRAAAGEPWGLAAGILMAFNEPFVQEAPRGLRLEFETLVWLAALTLLFVHRRAWTWQRVVAAGTLAGLLALTRSTYLPVMLVLIPYAAFEQRSLSRRWWLSAGAAALLMVILVVPHRYGMYKHRGDPFWDTAVYARWLANFEFVGRPGFPTAAELQVNGYAGDPITYAYYLFGLHSPRELAVGTARGYYALYRNMHQCTANVPPRDRCTAWKGRLTANGSFQLLALGGLMLAVMLGRGYLWVPLAFVIAAAPVAFLYDRGLLEAYRHTYQAFPLLLLAAALPLRHLVEWLRRRRSFSVAGPVLPAART